MAKVDQAENMIVAGLDQDWASCVECYENMTPNERGELALWLIGRNGDIREAPALILKQIVGYASAGFLETGLRWSKKHSD